MLSGITAAQVPITRVSLCAVGPGAVKGGKAPMYKNILVPLDFSPGSDKAIQAAATLARSMGGKLNVVTVLPEYGYSTVAQHFPKDAQEKARVDALEKLKSYVEEQGAGDVLGELSATQGSIYKKILDIAESSKADLIVISGRSEQWVDRFLMGSNAEKVVRYAGCTVLVVKG